MPARYFLDTNVLMYQVDPVDLRKRQVAHSIVTEAIATGDGCISTQVVSESLNTMIRLETIQLTTDEILEYLTEVLTPLLIETPSADKYTLAIEIRGRYGIHFYDALIVAAAIQSGCSIVLSEDLQAGQQYEGVTVVNPFA